ncbi:MAG: hypothetical protein K8T89_20275 [Planctomycetes bacterium]|nr:hypothetical protein [Planctomycetota bacterium]
MKRLFTAAMVMAVAFSTGCNRGTPGGPGATSTETNKNMLDVGNADNSFTLSVPSSLPLLSTKVKQGETTKVVIGIKRGKSFEQDVALKFEGLPSGVTIDQAGAQITRDKSEANLTFTATDAAALGDFEIKVVGHPTTGGDATNKFKITVEKKSASTGSQGAFTLGVPSSLPLLSTKVKQGESTKFVVSVKREKGFEQEVALKFEGLPTGVTIDQVGTKIAADKSEANLTLTAASTASLGDFDIKVIGHPVSGSDAVGTFKITVSK